MLVLSFICCAVNGVNLFREWKIGAAGLRKDADARYTDRSFTNVRDQLAEKIVSWLKRNSQD
jgi:hypothetical protein